MVKSMKLIISMMVISMMLFAVGCGGDDDSASDSSSSSSSTTSAATTPFAHPAVPASSAANTPTSPAHSISAANSSRTLQATFVS